MTYTSFDEMPFVLNVEDIADTLAIGKNKAYRLVNNGEIESLRIGKHFRIPRGAFVK